MEQFGRFDWISRAIFITDVDGIFTADPRLDDSARLVPSIEVDAFGQLQTTSSFVASKSLHQHDVTGGLEAKLSAAIAIAKTGKYVMIVKCGSKSAEAALNGESDFEVGTVVKLSP